MRKTRAAKVVYGAVAVAFMSPLNYISYCFVFVVVSSPRYCDATVELNPDNVCTYLRKAIDPELSHSDTQSSIARL